MKSKLARETLVATVSNETERLLIESRFTLFEELSGEIKKIEDELG